ncbi:hypothetical protein PPNK14_09680 [Pectobacterium parmentieri]
MNFNWLVINDLVQFGRKTFKGCDLALNNNTYLEVYFARNLNHANGVGNEKNIFLLVGSDVYAGICAGASSG